MNTVHGNFGTPKSVECSRGEVSLDSECVHRHTWGMHSVPPRIHDVSHSRTHAIF